MVDTKVTTVIVNATKQGLIMKVGNRHCNAKLTSVKVGGVYKMKMDVNWTYRSLWCRTSPARIPRSSPAPTTAVTYERITIKEDMAGQFDVQRDLRKEFWMSSSVVEEESSATTVSTWTSGLYRFMYV